MLIAIDLITAFCDFCPEYYFINVWWELMGKNRVFIFGFKKEFGGKVDNLVLPSSTNLVVYK